MIKEALNKIKSELPPHVKLVAVSKYHPLESIIEAYDAGQRIFAESRAQELHSKIQKIEKQRLKDENFLKDISFHFIGHLQRNKLKLVLPYVDLVESVDSVRLLTAIQKWAASEDKIINVLLQLHIAEEESKQGLTKEEILSILDEAESYPNVRFKGLMGMATFTEDVDKIKSEFQTISNFFSLIKEKYKALPLEELSIGMSGDYSIAIDYGSTMIRLGTIIFGSR